MKFNRILAQAAAVLVATGAAQAASHSQTENPMVGGAAMLPTMTIVDNAMNSQDHETLVAAVVQAGLAETLKGAGPFTVFAPTDDAFDMIAKDSLAALMMDENKAQLAQILTCHVVAASAMSDAIAGMIAADGGAHPVETLGGCTLRATLSGDTITLTDENGRDATVTIADVVQSNGVIHVIDRVLLPKQ
ncbi:fasciclin domain-containing protein [Thalassococcus sp. CAU 1522]|uniref:Fasciclin domain-containing protein n=1 Tax=Thalassococcus arenae TaxID=2851652 RepID=A0ABS6NBA4_9RHOB|nr:fasciclin domain-containing protein [Thalassococcus arenae]MBV2361294.1 fasciclin domain-containing protein [Thalassococcus arenae]